MIPIQYYSFKCRRRKIIVHKTKHKIALFIYRDGKHSQYEINIVTEFKTAYPFY